MSEALLHPDCRLGLDPGATLPQEIPAVVRELVGSCGRAGCYDHVNPVPLPNQEAMVEILQTARRILFPGYFTARRLDRVNLEYYLGQQLSRLHEALYTQIIWAIRHDCFRHHDQPCRECGRMAGQAATEFLKALPRIRLVLSTDIEAARQGDPAAASEDEIIFSYPGFLATTVHRLAHVLQRLEVPLLPRIMSEHAHSLTGIDIHPGAEIGQNFFIDHGTGVVVGQTCRIGQRVRLYQGVTLGALSLPRDAGESMRHKKRHPTIEDDVIIYSGATILGGETVIGARSIIGGNVWLTGSVPPDTKVVIKTPELVYLGPQAKRDPERF